MKKFLIAILIIFLALGICVTCSFLSRKKLPNDVEQVFNDINNKYYKISPEDSIKVLIVSLSDGNKKASVFANDNQSFDSFKSQIAKNYKDDYRLIKFDYVKNVEKILTSHLQRIIEHTEQNGFNKGLLIETVNNKIYLLPEEINFNRLIDYGGRKLDVSSINKYLLNRNISIDEIENLYTFDTTTYFYDVEKSDDIVEFFANNDNFKTRINDSFFEKEGFSTERLVDLENPFNNETFIYQLNPIDNNVLDEYTIIRHCLATYACMLDNFDENKDAIDRKIDYILNQVVKKDDDTYFIKEETDEELKLGACSLSALTLCEYYKKINQEDMELLDYIEKLGNGILYYQKIDGSFNHVLYENSFRVKDKFRVEFYDGEAVYGLLKIYGVLKDEKYLEASIKAIKSFDLNGFVKRGDHWLEYALREMLNYKYENQYVSMAIENAQPSINRVNNYHLTYSDFETIVQFHSILKLIRSEKYRQAFEIDEDILNTLPSDYTILEKAKLLMQTTYFFPEVSMYLEEPAKYEGLYFVRESNCRVRVDDVAHSIIACFELYKTSLY